MGKRFQSRPPSRTVRLGLSAVLAIGLMPWGGVAVAAEGEGGSTDVVASSSSVSGLYGWTSSQYSFDENGYLGISRPLRCFPCSTVYSLNTLPPFAAKTQLVPVNAAAPERRCFSWHTPENKNHRPFTEHGSKKGFIPRKPPHRAFSPPASSTTTEGARTCRRWS